MTNTIDLNTEKNAMLEFIQQRWAPNDYMKPVIDMIVDCAMKDSMHQFNGIDLSLAINALHEARVSAIEAEEMDVDKKDHVRYADAIIHQLSAFSSMAGLYDPAVRQGWDYDHQCKQVLKSVLKQHPEFAKAQPKDWASTSRDFDDEAIERYDWEENRESYRGNKEEIGLSLHIADRLAQPQVIKDWKSHGRSPLYSLVSGVYGYAASVFRHNTTVSMIAEVTQWAEQQGGFTFCAKGTFENEVLSLMHTQTKPSTIPAEFEAMVAHSREFRLLPESEKAAIRDENMKQVMQLFDVAGIARMDKENEDERIRVNEVVKNALSLPSRSAPSSSLDVELT